MRLLINFALLIQVQRRWDRADSQMGRLRNRLLSLNGCQLSHWPPFCAFCCRRDPKPWKVISESPQHLWVQKWKWSPSCRDRQGLQGCTCFSSRTGVPWETRSQCREKTGGFQCRNKSSIAWVHIVLWDRWYYPFLKKWDCQILCCLQRQAASFGIKCREMILCNQQSVEGMFMKSYDNTNRTNKVFF